MRWKIKMLPEQMVHLLFCFNLASRAGFADKSHYKKNGDDAQGEYYPVADPESDRYISQQTRY